MPRGTIKFGYRVSLQTENPLIVVKTENSSSGNNNGNDNNNNSNPSSSASSYMAATNNQLYPLGVISANAQSKLQFENAIFQIVSGDGEVTPDLPRKRVGEDVLFGQTVRLLHVNSNSLLGENRKSRASLEKSSYKTSLDRLNVAPAQATRWRILPRFKIRSEGQKVLDRDIILLQSASGETYLRISAACNSTTDYIFEAASGANPTGFSIEVFDTDQSDSRYSSSIRCGDCIQMLHREYVAFVSAIGTQKVSLDPLDPSSSAAAIKNLAMNNNNNNNNNSPTNNNPTMKNTNASSDYNNKEEENTNNSFAAASPSTSQTENQQQQVNNNSSNAINNSTTNNATDETMMSGNDGGMNYRSTSLFVVENEDVYSGGPVMLGRQKRYRLKSLLSGNYLCAMLMTPEEIEIRNKYNQQQRSMTQQMIIDAEKKSLTVRMRSSIMINNNNNNDGTLTRSNNNNNNSNNVLGEFASSSTPSSPRDNLPSNASFSTAADAQGYSLSNLNASTVLDGVPMRQTSLNNTTTHQQQLLVGNTEVVDQRVPELKVGLVSDPDHRGCSVSFHQAGDESSPFARDHSRVFLEFPQVLEGVWLSEGDFVALLSNVEDYSTELGVPSGDNRIRAMKTVCCYSSVPQKDGLELLRVPPAEFQELNYVISLFQPLQKLRLNLKGDNNTNVNNAAKSSSPTSPAAISSTTATTTTVAAEFLRPAPPMQIIDQVRENLTRLIHLCTKCRELNPMLREGTPQPKMQAWLVDQGVAPITLDIVEQILKFLYEHEQLDGTNSPFRLRSHVRVSLFEVCELGCRLLRQCAYRNKITSSEFALYLPRFFALADEPNLGVKDTLVEIFRDHRNLVDHPDDTRQIELVMKHVQNSKRLRGGSASRLLMVLTVCQGRGLKEPQKIIGNTLLEPMVRQIEQKNDPSAASTKSKVNNINDDDEDNDDEGGDEKTKNFFDENREKDLPYFSRLWMGAPDPENHFSGVYIDVGFSLFEKLIPGSDGNTLNNNNNSNNKDDKKTVATSNNKDTKDEPEDPLNETLRNFVKNHGSNSDNFVTSLSHLPHHLRNLAYKNEMPFEVFAQPLKLKTDKTKLVENGIRHKNYIGSNKLLQSFSRQLELFAALCTDDHEANIERVKQICPPECLFALLEQTRRIHGRIRAGVHMLFKVLIITSKRIDLVESTRSIIYVMQKSEDKKRKKKRRKKRDHSSGIAAELGSLISGGIKSAISGGKDKKQNDGNNNNPSTTSKNNIKNDAAVDFDGHNNNNNNNNSDNIYDEDEESEGDTDSENDYEPETFLPAIQDDSSSVQLDEKNNRLKKGIRFLTGVGGRVGAWIGGAKARVTKDKDGTTTTANKKSQQQDDGANEEMTLKSSQSKENDLNNSNKITINNNDDDDEDEDEAADQNEATPSPTLARKNSALSNAAADYYHQNNNKILSAPPKSKNTDENNNSSSTATADDNKNKNENHNSNNAKKEDSNQIICGPMIPRQQSYHRNSLVSKYVHHLLDYLIESASSDDRRHASEIHENHCIAEAIASVGELIRFGWIPRHELIDWLIVLRHSMDGRNMRGIQKDNDGWNRFDHDNGSHFVAMVKLNAIKAISNAASLIEVDIVSRLLKEFEKGNPLPLVCPILDFRTQTDVHELAFNLWKLRKAREDEKIQDTSLISENLRQLREIGSGVLDVGRSVFKDLGIDALKDRVVEVGSKIGSKIGVDKNKSEDEKDSLQYLNAFIDVLLDNCLYEIPVLVVESAALLLRLTDVYHSLAPLMARVQILPSASSLEFFRIVKPIEARLRRYQVETISSAEIQFVIKDIQTLKTGVRDSDTNIIDFEKHSILCNMSLHTIVATISRRNENRQLIETCCEFLLTVLSVSNPESVQTDLSVFIDVFAKHIHSTPHLAASLLEKIFSKRVDICTSIPETTLIDIGTALSQCKHIPAVAYTLRLLVFQEDVDVRIIRTNQEAILNVLLGANGMLKWIRCTEFFTEKSDGYTAVERIQKLVDEGEYLRDDSEIMFRVQVLLSVYYSVQNRDTAVKAEVRQALFGEGVNPLDQFVICFKHPPFISSLFFSLFRELYVDDLALTLMLSENPSFSDCIIAAERALSTGMKQIEKYDASSSPTSAMALMAASQQQQQQLNHSNSEDQEDQDGDDYDQNRTNSNNINDLMASSSSKLAPPAYSPTSGGDTLSSVLDGTSRSEFSLYSGKSHSTFRFEDGEENNNNNNNNSNTTSSQPNNKNNKVMNNNKEDLANEIVAAPPPNSLVAKKALHSRAACVRLQLVFGCEMFWYRTVVSLSTLFASLFANFFENGVPRLPKAGAVAATKAAYNFVRFARTLIRESINAEAAESSVAIRKHRLAFEQKLAEAKEKNLSNLPQFEPCSVELKRFHVLPNLLRSPSAIYFCVDVTGAPRTSALANNYISLQNTPPKVFEIILMTLTAIKDSGVHHHVAEEVFSNTIELLDALDSGSKAARDESNTLSETMTQFSVGSRATKKSHQLLSGLVGGGGSNLNNQSDNGTVLSMADTNNGGDDGEEHVFVKWQKAVRKYIRFFEKDITTCGASRVSATVMLRKCTQGHEALKSVSFVLDSPLIDSAVKGRFFDLFSQTLEAQDDVLSDASLLIAEDDPFPTCASLAELVELKKQTLTLDKTLAERQDILSQWSVDFCLPPKTARSLSLANQDAVFAAINCGNVVLRDGNLKAQNTIYNFFVNATKEDFFVYVRKFLNSAKNMLRDREQAKSRQVGSLSQLSGKTYRFQRNAIMKRLDTRYNFDLHIVTLKYLQLLAEGHNLTLQNYMRYQEDNQLSINLLEPVIGVFEVLSSEIDPGTFPLALQTLATLVEVVQGPCVGNQRYLISQNIGGHVSDIFANRHKLLSRKQQWELKKACMILLNALLERHMDLALVSNLMSSIKMQLLVDCMDSTYKRFKGESLISVIKRKVPQSLHFVGAFVRPLFVIFRDVLQSLLLPKTAVPETEDELNLSCAIFIFMKTILDIQQLETGSISTGSSSRYAVGNNSDEKNSSNKFDEGNNNNNSSNDNSDNMTDLPIEDGTAIVDAQGKTLVQLFRQSTSFQKMTKVVATIEIFRNNQCERCYFRVPTTFFENLQQASKTKLLEEVDRSGDARKIGDFFERSYNIIREIEYYEEMSHRLGLSLIYKYAPLLDNIALLTAFVLNFLLLGYQDISNDAVDPLSNMPPGPAFDSYQRLGALQIVLQSLLFVNFWFSDLRIWHAVQWQQWQEEKNKEAVAESKALLGIIPPQVDEDAKSKLPQLVVLLLNAKFFFTCTALYKYSLFLVLAFIGYYFSPIAYCFLMLQLVVKLRPLYEVVLSITNNKLTLFLTFIFLLIFIFIFTSIAYWNFSTMFSNTDTLGAAGCDSLIQCFFSILVHGLKSGGGISDLATVPLYTKPDSSAYYFRLVYDLAFFVILILLSLNVVFGIIIDAFSALREQREGLEEDQESKCFICCRERSDLDKIVGGFEQHIKFEHNMWLYPAFMQSVQKIHESEHTGQEGHVYECIKSHDPSWIPIGSALSLEAVDQKQQKKAVDRNLSSNSNSNSNNKYYGGFMAGQGGSSNSDGSFSSSHHQSLLQGLLGLLGDGGDGGDDDEIAALQKLINKRKRKRRLIMELLANEESSSSSENSSNNDDDTGGSSNNNDNDQILPPPEMKQEKGGASGESPKKFSPSSSVRRHSRKFSTTSEIINNNNNNDEGDDVFDSLKRSRPHVNSGGSPQSPSQLSSTLNNNNEDRETPRRRKSTVTTIALPSSSEENNNNNNKSDDQITERMARLESMMENVATSLNAVLQNNQNRKDDQSPPKHVDPNDDNQNDDE